MDIYRRKRRGGAEKLQKIHPLEAGLLLAVILLLAGGVILDRQQAALSKKLIRLHVVANSDTAADQRIKLQVRDAVLDTAAGYLQTASTQDAARAALREHLPDLTAAADDCLRRAGSGDRAQVTLGQELFGTRAYETFSLPGGWYEALRVTIGAGQGHNWWCVVFPAVCTAATSDELESRAAMAGLNGEEIALIEGNGEYRIKLKSMELVEELLNWFRQ